MLAAAVSLAASVLVLTMAAEPSEAAIEGENKVAFTKFNQRSEEGQIVAVTPDGSDQITLGSGFSPSYSPDGSKVIFECFTGDNERDFNQDIYVMNADGTDVQPVTSGRAYDYSPVFLDNATVAFVRDSGRNRTDVFKKVIGTDGSQNLTDNPGIYGYLHHPAAGWRRASCGCEGVRHGHPSEYPPTGRPAAFDRPADHGLAKANVLPAHVADAPGLLDRAAGRHALPAGRHLYADRLRVDGAPDTVEL